VQHEQSFSATGAAGIDTWGALLRQGKARIAALDQLVKIWIRVRLENLSNFEALRPPAPTKTAPLKLPDYSHPTSKDVVGSSQGDGSVFGGRGRGDSDSVSFLEGSLRGRGTGSGAGSRKGGLLWFSILEPEGPWCVIRI